MVILSRNKPTLRLGLIFCAVILFLTACQEISPEPGSQSLSLPTTDIQMIRPSTVDGLEAYFQALNYHWKSLDQGVPPFILEQFPDNFNAPLNITQRKRVFFMGLLPMVLLINHEVANERRTLLALLKQHKETGDLHLEQAEWLQRLADSYGLRGNPLTDHRVRAVLLRRVDTLPAALVLAQAANESAWGTSRFAREGNNLFGQWTFTPGTGIVPKGRPPGATYEVRRFRDLEDSIRGYFTNLNTHAAYRELRKTRQTLRTQGKEVTGKILAGGLSRYSSRGYAYVREIQSMIDHNNLERLNQVALGNIQSDATETVGPTGSGLLSSRYQINRQDVAAAAPPTVD